MKKFLSLILVLIVCLSLVACGAKASLADLTNCPITSVQESEAFLKKSGVEITHVTENYVAFSYGDWEGTASPTAIGLSISSILAKNYTSEVEAMVKEVETLCGEPYSTREDGGVAGVLSSTLAFYMYPGGKIAVSTSKSALGNSTRVMIYPGQ